MTASPRLALKASHRKLGLWLAFIAGAVNAGGFLMVGHYTSHMTGIASQVGDALALSEASMALAALAFLASFIFGAMTTALLVNRMRDRQSGTEYSSVLMLEAALLTALIAMAEAGAPIVLITALLCFMMGLQNALITKISGAIIRTTHVTGLATDIGIELGRSLYKSVSGNHQMTLYPEKLRLFASLLFAFIGGGIAGAFAVMQLGIVSLLALSLVLLWLAWDIRRAS